MKLNWADRLFIFVMLTTFMLDVGGLIAIWNATKPEPVVIRECKCPTVHPKPIGAERP